MWIGALEQNPINIDLAPIVWKHLVGQKVDISDIESIDEVSTCLPRTALACSALLSCRMSGEKRPSRTLPTFDSLPFRAALPNV